MTQRGRFVTLEGIEGAGKSTAAAFVMEWLAARQIPAVLTREPGGTPLAESLRELVLRPREERLPVAAETLLMFAARSVHVTNLIAPSLARGTWVVCDRFVDASYAYQGAGRGVAEAWLRELAVRCLDGVIPDLTLLLDLPVAVGLGRARARKGQAAADRFESEGEAFFERVRARYQGLAADEPERFAVIDAAADLVAVQEQIVRALAPLLAPAAP